MSICLHVACHLFKSLRYFKDLFFTGYRKSQSLRGVLEKYTQNSDLTFLNTRVVRKVHEILS